MTEFDLDKIVQDLDERDEVDITPLDEGSEEQSPMSPKSPGPVKRQIPSRVMGKDRLPGSSTPTAAQAHVADDWCNAIEAGKIAGKSPTWAYAAAARGDIVSKRYSGAQVFLKSSLGAKKGPKAAEAAPETTGGQLAAQEPSPAAQAVLSGHQPMPVKAGLHPAFEAIQTQMRLALAGQLAPGLALAAIAGIASHAAGR